MQAISDGIGNGTVDEISIGQAIKSSWCDFMTINVNFECSEDICSDNFKWHCKSGINAQTM